MSFTLRNMIIAILGECATGKSELEKMLEDKGYYRAISFTSRPKRNNEVDGVDYHFVSKEDFFELDSQGKLFEQTSYVVKGEIWYYGVGKDSFKDNEINVIVVNPNGLRQLLKNEEIRDRLYVVRLISSLENRIDRYLKRENAECGSKPYVYVNLVERIKKDSIDFNENNLSFLDMLGGRVMYCSNDDMKCRDIVEIAEEIDRWIKNNIKVRFCREC